MKRLDSPFLIKDISTCQLCIGFWALWASASGFCIVCAQSCPTLQPAIDCSPPGSFVHGILQARMLELVAIRVSSPPKNWTCVCCVSCIGSQIIYPCAAWEATLSPPPHTPQQLDTWLFSHHNPIGWLKFLISFLHTFPTIDIFFPCYKWNILYKFWTILREENINYISPSRGNITSVNISEPS